VNTTLEVTYNEISRILGNNTEPLESVWLVETYRRYLKPETVRVVLLAESHVFTSVEDRRIAIPAIDDLPEYPTQYARFVYCLGLGERELTNDPHHPRRDGTPQFWKVLYACDNRVERLEDFTPIQRRTPFPQRLQNKIRLLKHLRSKGIWLVDASVCAGFAFFCHFLSQTGTSCPLFRICFRLKNGPQVLKPVEEMPYVIPGTLLAVGMQVGHSGVVQVTLECIAGFPFH
jgi:hypothetical protein